MKTAMQNHIADMKKIQEMVKSKNLDKDLEVTILESIEGCIENAESFLETEKQLLKNAYLQGDEYGFYSTESRSDYETESRSEHISEKYFNETFKSDE